MTELIEFIATCVVLMWIPGAHNTNYEFFEDGIMTEATREESTIRCRTTYYTPVTYWLVGLNDAGDRSENSNSLEVQWVFNFDCDENGSVGFTDFGALIAAFGKPPPTSGCDFDANESGWVGFPDFGAFLMSVGQCNDERKVVPCGS